MKFTPAIGAKNDALFKRLLPGTRFWLSGAYRLRCVSLRAKNRNSSRTATWFALEPDPSSTLKKM